MSRYTYDFGNYGKKKELKEGIFSGEIVYVIDKKTKAGDDMLSIKILLSDGADVIEVWDNIVLHSNDTKKEKMANHLMSFFMSIGIPLIDGKIDFDSQELKGKKVKVKIGIKQPDSYNPEATNKIDSYISPMLDTSSIETEYNPNNNDLPF